MSVALIRFLGSNCDQDAFCALTAGLGATVKWVFYTEESLPEDTTAVLLPGGFSYGDYLRAGILAAKSPIMPAVKRFAERGGPVLGICNGFQVLCEAGLLPGALMQNAKGRFVCAQPNLQIENHNNRYFRNYDKASTIRFPVAHMEGNYYAPKETLEALERNKQVALTYGLQDKHGNAELNGSIRSIAGIFGGPKNNVFGLMPHPERAVIGPQGTDGISLLRAFASWGQL